MRVLSPRAAKRIYRCSCSTLFIVSSAIIFWSLWSNDFDDIGVCGLLGLAMLSFSLILPVYVYCRRKCVIHLARVEAPLIV